jgi:TPR repeat protein
MNTRLMVVLSILVLAVEMANAGLDEGRVAFERADYPAAFRELQPLAEQGNAFAQSRLGRIHLQGLGVARNPAEALKWLRKAVDQGDAHAQALLGFMYVEGTGVGRDVAEGLRWLRLAADQGDPLAQNMLGSMYRHGQGVAKDEAEALKWIGRAADGFRKAADQGDASAQNMLASMYANGQGVAKDEAEALKWYRKAADQGYAGARFRLIALEKKLAAANRDRPSSATPSPPQSDPALRVYDNAVHRWSVSYPSDWKLDAADAAYVRVFSPAGDGQCGLHSSGGGNGDAHLLRRPVSTDRATSRSWAVLRQIRHAANSPDNGRSWHAIGSPESLAP